jgi:hypothetical protein
VRRGQVRTRSKETRRDLSRRGSLGGRRIDGLGGPLSREAMAARRAAGEVEVDSFGEEEGADKHRHGGLPRMSSPSQADRRRNRCCLS